MGKLAFMGEGQGDNIAPAIYVMQPTPPYNTTGKLVIMVEADNSDSEQLLWTAIQLAQRCRYSSPEQGNVLYRRHLRFPPRLPSSTSPAQSGVPLQPQDWTGQCGS